MGFTSSSQKSILSLQYSHTFEIDIFLLSTLTRITAKISFPCSEAHQKSIPLFTGYPFPASNQRQRNESLVPLPCVRELDVYVKRSCSLIAKVKHRKG